MFLKRALPLFTGAVLTMGALSPVATAQFVSDEIVREVVSTFDAPLGVEGALIYEQRGNRTDFTIVAEGLPAGAYTVTIDGVFRGFLSSFVDNASTVAELTFSTRQRGDRLLLNFEPRGKLIEIRSVLDEDLLYASGTLPFAVDASENEAPEYEKTKIREEFQIMDGSFAQARVDIKSNKRKAQADFKVKGLVPGVYVLRGNGVAIGSIVAEGRGKGNIRFSTNPRGPQSDLTFDPTGVQYELVRVDLSEDLMVAQTNVGEAQKPGGDLLPIGDAESEFTSSGFDTNATAKATLENDTEFAEMIIESRGLPIGTYSVELEIINTNSGAVLGLIELGTMNVALEDPEDDDMVDGGDVGGTLPEGDGNGEGGEPVEMLPQGVGADEARDTIGYAYFGTDAMTRDGEVMSPFGGRVFELPRMPLVPGLVDDLQSLRIRLVNDEDQTYLIGRFPDSSFNLPKMIEEMP